MTPAAVEAPAGTDAWQSFAEHVSGEWEGITATFSPAGQPQPLPEHYVPGAFREWGVELWDWQSQCSCLAVPEEGPDSASTGSRRLRSVVRRLMPTVGCEADAIAFTEEDASSSSSSNSSDASSSDAGSGQELLYSADGSYSLGLALLPAISKDDGPSKFQVEHCFALPTASTATAADSSSGSSRMRVKVVQQFRRDWSTGAWKLDGVDLHREKFDGPYTGKRELAGCGGGQPGIAQLPALQANQLAGDWAAAATAQEDARLSCVDAAGGAPEAVQLTLLPLQAWSAIQFGANGQLHRAEAGVLLGAEQQGDGGSSSSSSSKERMVSCRLYDAGTGQLQGASLGQEVVRR